MRYNTPDNIVLNGKVLSWKDKDALPFFLMSDGKIIKCDKSQTHNDFINSHFNSMGEKRRFINNVILQGRQWINSNAFSFWTIGDDDYSLVKYVLNKMSNNKNCYVYYKSKLYRFITEEDGYQWLRKMNSDNNIDRYADISDKKNIIEHWFDSDMKFVQNNFLMSIKKGNNIAYRELNNYELLAATCYQLWADFFMNPNSRFDKFSLDDLILFIDIKYKGRTSFQELFDYFHDSMRKKAVYKNNVSEEDNNIGDYQNNDFETLMNDYGFDDSEYRVINYENTDEPYSCKVRTYDFDKINNLIQSLKNSDYIVDRVNSRKIDDNIKVYSARIRKKIK